MARATNDVKSVFGHQQRYVMRAKHKADAKPRGTSSRSPATAHRKAALLVATRNGAFNRIFVNRELATNLATAVRATDEVMIVSALSGG